MDRLRNLKRTGKIGSPLIWRRAIRDLLVANDEIALLLCIAGIGCGEALSNRETILIGFERGLKIA